MKPFVTAGALALGLSAAAVHAAPTVYVGTAAAVKPNFLDPNIGAPFRDSTFTVTLRQGNVVVDSFSFNAPDDVAAFVGASSASLFNTIQIRETVGGVENEFFGQFYTAANLPRSGVPEPDPWAMMLTGLGLAGGALRRRRAATASLAI